MANEIQARGPGTGKTTYFLVRGQSFNIGLIWNSSSFVSYLSTGYAAYPVSMTEQGTSNFYTGTFPPAIPPGTYSIVVKQQIGGSPAETDPEVATGNFEWNGSYPAPISDLATSGQIGQIGPVRLARGTMIQNWGVYLVSSTDHSTPFTSGIVSGQIARDGGTFTALQSGAFSEIGTGWYNLQALTSGDLLCNTAKLLFTGVGVSGGVADSRNYFLILQKTSGVA